MTLDEGGWRRSVVKVIRSSAADWSAASPWRAAAAHSSARQPFHEPVSTVSRSRQPDGSTNSSTDARRLPGCGGRSACDAHLVATAPALNSGPTRRMDRRVGSPRANKRSGAGTHAANAGANDSRVERREFRHGAQTPAQNSTAARRARALALGRARQLDACRGRRRLRRPAAPDSRLPRAARPSAGCVRRARGLKQVLRPLRGHQDDILRSGARIRMTSSARCSRQDDP